MSGQTAGTTRNLTNDTIIVQAADNAMQVTLTVLSGTCTITGSRPFKNLPSDPGVLAAGATLTLTAISGAPLDGWTLTAAGGTTLLVIM